MQPIKDWQAVKPYGGDSRKLPAGGYVCKIIGAKEEISQAGNKMLVIALDIAEGEFTGFFRDKYNGTKWPNQAILRILEPDPNKDDPDQYARKAGRIKRFIMDVEGSNDSYVFQWDESTLRGKYVGGLFGEEEFEKQDGGTAWSVKIFYSTTRDKIATGSFSIPNKRPLEQPPAEFTQPVDTSVVEAEDDLPF